MMENEIFRVVIRQITPLDFSEELKSRVIQSIYFFEDAIKSNYFKDSVLNFNNSSDGFNKRYNLELDNKGVYLKVINAVEENGNIERFTSDLFLNFILSDSPDGRTIGFVENSSKRINTYVEFVTKLPIPNLSAHFAHEWTHLLGFKHPVDTGINYQYLSRTIPYAIENIVENYLYQKTKDLLII